MSSLRKRTNIDDSIINYFSETLKATILVFKSKINFVQSYFKLNTASLAGGTNDLAMKHFRTF